MPDQGPRPRKRRLDVKKDKSIDTGRIYPYRIVIDPFVFRMYVALEPLFNESANYTMMRHNHRNFELHGFIEGSGSFEAEDGIFGVKPQSFCLVGPWVYHMHRMETGMSARKYTLAFDYTVERENTASFRAARCAQAAKALSELGCLYEPDGARICALLENLKNELANRDAFLEYRVQNILSDIMIEILRCLSKGKNVSAVSRPDADMRDLKIEIFFDEHYGEAELTAR